MTRRAQRNKTRNGCVYASSSSRALANVSSSGGALRPSHGPGALVGVEGANSPWRDGSKSDPVAVRKFDPIMIFEYAGWSVIRINNDVSANMNGDEPYMTMAIDEAKKCRPPRSRDPLVGAVLVKDGDVETAYRGQEEPNDHAEFTLLHKRLRSVARTEGGTLYTTLEPCTTRNHDKLPCADWIIQKRISRVVIGILDPNPVICGKGYWRLVDAGVQVDFFPFTLAKQILALNEQFRQAQLGGRDVAPNFAVAVTRWKNPTIAQYVGLGWNDALSLQDCPDHRSGWSLAQVQITEATDGKFEVPERWIAPFNSYFREKYGEKRFQDDGEKFMLTRNPIAFSDSPSLSLETRSCKFSETQFIRDNVATIAADRNPLIAGIVQGSLKIEFPHSLCLHLVVATSDRKILLTQRSAKVAFHPGTWSVSAEEQLARDDFKDGPDVVAKNWFGRMLKEEFGLESDAYLAENARIMSVFLESDLLSVGVVGYVELAISSTNLRDILYSQSRIDYEYSAIDFYDLDRQTILRELFRPSRTYHPTSGYRLIFAFLRNFGNPGDDEISGYVAR